MKIKTLIILFALTGVVNAACGSQKSTVKGDTIPGSGSSGTFVQTEYFSQLNANKSKEKCLTAKIKCEVSMDGKSISTSGHLRMKKDDVIQISLLDPLVGMMEVIRMEFTKDMMLMVDRYNKKYIYVPYGEVDFLKKCDIDFIALENLFWNHIFVPAKPEAEASDFVFEKPDGTAPDTSSDVTLKYVDDHLTYCFNTSKAVKRLVETVITGNRDKNSKFAFSYANFQPFHGTEFPNEMIMSFIMGSKNASLSFVLSSVKNKSGWETRTKIPTKYTKEDPERIFRSLMGSN
jgi:hypothetical protein